MTVRRESHALRGHGLGLHVHRFVDDAAAACGWTLLLLHGFLDAGGSWDLVARELAPRGIEVYAVDLRGFGLSDRVGAGGYYHFPDYVADVDALVRQLVIPGRLAVAGHSMGGTVAALFAGARPESVQKLALLEGVGPPAMPVESALARTRAWLDQLERPRAARPLASAEDALARLALTHPSVPEAVLRTRVDWLVRRDGDRLQWAHDPLHRTTSPASFQVEVFRTFLAAVACPVLFIGGGAIGWHPEDEAERLAVLRDVRRVDIEGAGHMMHWTRPEEVARALGSFLIDGRSR